MKISAAQIECKLGEIHSNIQKVETYTKWAAESGCDLVVFPEMVDTGWEMSAIRTHAQNWDTGPIHDVKAMAAQHNIAIICGLSKRINKNIYNCLVTISNTGEVIGEYDKTHLFSTANEQQTITPGSSLKTVQINGMTIGLMLCYEIRFPEVSRALALRGAEILVVSAAFPSPREEHWRTLTRCRAIENQLYLVAANRVGTDGDLTFCGESCIIDPYGFEIASTYGPYEDLIMGTVDKQEIVTTRAGINVFRDRRPGLY